MCCLRRPLQEAERPARDSHGGITERATGVCCSLRRTIINLPLIIGNSAMKTSSRQKTPARGGATNVEWAVTARELTLTCHKSLGCSLAARYVDLEVSVSRQQRQTGTGTTRDAAESRARHLQVAFDPGTELQSIYMKRLRSSFVHHACSKTGAGQANTPDHRAEDMQRQVRELCGMQCL